MNGNNYLLLGSSGPLVRNIWERLMKKTLEANRVDMSLMDQTEAGLAQYPQLNMITLGRRKMITITEWFN